MGFVAKTAGKIGKSFEPTITTKATNTQASPFARNFLQQLTERQNAGIEGHNTLQQEAGTAIRQFMGGNKAFDFGPGFTDNPFVNLKMDLGGVPSKIDLSSVRDASFTPSVRDVNSSVSGFSSGMPSLGGVRDIGVLPQLAQIGSIPMTGSGIRRGDSDIRQIDTSDIVARDIPTNIAGIRDVGTSINPVRDVNLDLGPQQFNLANMVRDLALLSSIGVEEQAGNLREQHGIAGTRFGSSLARGEADLRAKALPMLSAQIGEMMSRADESRRGDAALKLQANTAGVQRDTAINELLQNLTGLGIQRDTSVNQMLQGLMDLGLKRDLSLAGAMTDRLNTGVQRDSLVAEQGIQRDQLASNELMQLLSLNLNRDIAVGDQTLRGGDQVLRAGEAGIQRDLGMNQALMQMFGLSTDRDAARAGAETARLDTGIRRDMSINDIMATLSGQNIQRDLGVQGNEMQKALSIMDLMNNMKQAEANFNLNKTQAGQADNLARTGLRVDDNNQNNARMLQAIQLMGQLGNDQLAPLIQMALAGIQPDAHIVKDGKGKAIADGIGGVLQGIGSIIPG